MAESIFALAAGDLLGEEGRDGAIEGLLGTGVGRETAGDAFSSLGAGDARICGGARRRVRGGPEIRSAIRKMRGVPRYARIDTYEASLGLPLIGCNVILLGTLTRVD